MKVTFDLYKNEYTKVFEVADYESKVEIAKTCIYCNQKNPSIDWLYRHQKNPGIDIGYNVTNKQFPLSTMVIRNRNRYPSSIMVIHNQNHLKKYINSYAVTFKI